MGAAGTEDEDASCTMSASKTCTGVPGPSQKGPAWAGGRGARRSKVAVLHRPTSWLTRIPATRGPASHDQVRKGNGFNGRDH